MSEEVLLEVRHLSTQFRTEHETVRAVDNISFTLNKGETIGIVGESGSGKSVTALSVMRLIPKPPGRITSGELVYRSKSRGLVDLASLPEKEMRAIRGNDIAMIFQEPMTSLNPVYTCGRQVVEAITFHQKLPKREAGEKALHLFSQVQLARPEIIFNSYPHQVSGGQKQRVMIAMAMSCRPNILIADEPTTALDVTVQHAILDLMAALQQQYGIAVVFITHDLGVVAEIASRVLVMYKGRIVEQGGVGDVFANPRHPYTKGLLACRPPLDRRLRSLPTVSDFVTTGDDGAVKERGGTVEQVVRRLEITAEELDSRRRALCARKPILRVRNLKAYLPVRTKLLGRTKEFVKAVDDVTFDVYPGETLGLVGESGCGKTTLGRTLLRLVEPCGGEIIFRDQSVLDLPAEQLRQLRRNLQLIFQDPYSSLNPRMTAGAAVMEPMKVHGIASSDSERRDRAMELLERVNLDPSHFYRYPHEFSGGQRQRVCIARALSVSPQFLICDESVSALDVSIQAQVLNLLARLREELNFTCIFISHDLSVVKFMSDRMAVMHQGRIEEIGDADEVCCNPKTDYARRLIDAIPKGRRIQSR